MALALLALSQVLACNSDTTVPFKRPGATASEGAPADRQGEADAHPPFVSIELPEGPTSVDLEGLELNRDQGHLHAALVRNTPEMRDVLVVASGLDQGVRLEQARRTSNDDDPAFGELQRVGTLTPGSGDCELSRAQVEAPSPTYVVVHIDWRCREATQIAALGNDNPPTPAGPVRETSTIHIFSNDRSPRKVEELALTPNGTSPAPTITKVTGDDSDGDGHADLQLWLALEDGGEPRPAQGDTPDKPAEEEPAMALSLLNRSAGLQVGMTEPESTLATLAEQAQQQLGKQPAQALEIASKAQRIYDDYCRGAGEKRIAIGGRAGLPCARSAALGRLSSVRLMAHALRGDVMAAAKTYSDLETTGHSLTAADQKRVDAALARLPRAARYLFVQGPQLSSLPLPPQHRPLVAFLDESNLLLRGDPPQTFNLADGTRTPTAMVPPSALFADPGGRYVATEFVRDCHGDKLRLFRPTQLLAGRTSGAPLAEVLVRPADQAASCTGQAQARRVPTQELSLLRLGPDGLLIHAGPELLLLSLSEPLASAGPAQPYQWGRALPRDSQPDAIAQQPPLIPLLSELGVLLVDARTGRATILDTAGVSGGIRDVALSPNAEQIAIATGEQVWLGRALLAQ